MVLALARWFNAAGRECAGVRARKFSAAFPVRVCMRNFFLFLIVFWLLFFPFSLSSSPLLCLPPLLSSLPLSPSLLLFFLPLLSGSSSSSPLLHAACCAPTWGCQLATGDCLV